MRFRLPKLFRFHTTCLLLWSPLIHVSDPGAYAFANFAIQEILVELFFTFLHGTLQIFSVKVSMSHLEIKEIVRLFNGINVLLHPHPNTTIR